MDLLDCAQWNSEAEVCVWAVPSYPRAWHYVLSGCSSSATHESHFSSCAAWLGTCLSPHGALSFPGSPRLVCSSLGHTSTSIGWLSWGHWCHFRGGFFWSWSWSLGIAAPGCRAVVWPRTQKHQGPPGCTWWEDREGAAWADPACPAVHCSNCGCLSPSCAWLDCSTQGFRLTSYGNGAESCSLCQSICHFAWKEASLHMHEKAGFS